jgi:IS605 OrfB family transposase
VETDAKGNYLQHTVINFDLKDKTSGQIQKIIENVVVEVLKWAAATKKPIVIEDLDLAKKKFQMGYGNKKANRKISMLAYRAFVIAILSRADKIGVGVYKVDPAYTSLIGKTKYMKKLGVSVHVAAAYTIARRGLNYKERIPSWLSAFVPEKIRHRGLRMQWGSLFRQLSGLHTHQFYALPGMDLKGSTVKKAIASLVCRETNLISAFALVDPDDPIPVPFLNGTCSG